jgi:hypothetical protein
MIFIKRLNVFIPSDPVVVGLGVCPEEDIFRKIDKI